MTNNKKRQGFTLIEVLVVAVLTIMLASGVLSLQYILGQNQITVWDIHLNTEEANSNVSALVREIRNARPADTGAYALEVASEDELVFYSDIDFDSDTERVRYTLNGENLEKGVIDPVGFPAVYPSENEKVRVVAEHVKNAAGTTFTYYNGDWPTDTTNNPLPAPARLSDTKLMKVHLEINSKDEGENFILETYAHIRTLKEN